MENENYKLENLKRKELKLAEVRERIFKLSSEKIVDAILDYEMPGSLVQSIPKEDLYFLIHDIGLDDALPILALSDGSQWEYILDLEVWEKDRINFFAITQWLERLYEADRHRLVNWLVREKTEFLELCLFNNIEVRIREEDEDPSDFGDEFFTVDDVFYVRFRSDISEMLETDDALKDQIENSRYILEKMIYLLADINHIAYQNVLLETMSILPAELEEEIYRMKNVRLSEKGFLPYDDAISIYTPAKEEEFKDAPDKVFPSGVEDGKILPSLPVAYGFGKGGSIFATAVSAITSQALMSHIHIEFASLCNQLISADQQKIRTKEELLLILEKASHYLSIGLEILMEGNDIHEPALLAALVKKHPLVKIFRLGYGKAMALKFKADKWVRKSWFKSKGLPIGFWGEIYMGFLGGVLLKRPMYFDNYENGLLYREFYSYDQIRKVEARILELMDYDDLFSLVTIDFKNFPNTYLNYKNMLLTLWVCHYLKIDPGRPVTITELKSFFPVLWKKAKKKSPEKIIDDKMKTSFLNWLSEETGLTTHEISDRMAKTFELLFKELEEEFSHVKEEDLDAKYIHLFCMDEADD